LDNAGNRGYSTLTEIRVDKTTPTASFSGDGSTCEQITWLISGASDSGGSGLASQPYSFNNGASWTASNTYTESVAGGGTVTRTARVRDNAGNEWSKRDTVSAALYRCFHHSTLPLPQCIREIATGNTAYLPTDQFSFPRDNIP
jgi:hypothetical protein